VSFSGAGGAAGGASGLRPPSGRASIGGGAYATLPPVPGMDAYDRAARAAPPPPPRAPLAFDDMPVGRAGGAGAPPGRGYAGGAASLRAPPVRPGGRL